MTLTGVSACCVTTVQKKVDVAQRVDELLFLYTSIRLRLQRNETTVGRIVPSYLLRNYNGGPLGNWSQLLIFQNISVHAPGALLPVSSQGRCAVLTSFSSAISCMLEIVGNSTCGHEPSTRPRCCFIRGTTRCIAGPKRAKDLHHHCL